MQNGCTVQTYLKKMNSTNVSTKPTEKMVKLNKTEFKF